MITLAAEVTGTASDAQGNDIEVAGTVVELFTVTAGGIAVPMARIEQRDGSLVAAYVGDLKLDEIVRYLPDGSWITRSEVDAEVRAVEAHRASQLTQTASTAPQYVIGLNASSNMFA